MENRERETDVLSAVIETEREIQTILEEEKKKRREWIDRVRTEAELQIAAEEERLKESAAHAIAAAAAAAEAKAAELVNGAILRAERLARLDDETLLKIAARYLLRILPGE